jgi:GWxTD domain-containing protein
LRSDATPYFTADLAITLDKDQQPAISISITVPYQEMEWLLIDGGRYGAGVEFTVVIDNKKAGSQAGDTFERRVVVGGFSSTHEAGQSIVEKRTFAVPSGKANIRIQVRDVNSHEESKVSQSLDVPDYARLPVGFADLELGVADSAATFQPISTRRFGPEISRLAVRAWLFDRRPGEWPRHYPLHYNIRDEDGQVLITGTQDINLSASGDPVVIRPDRTDLFLGSYVFEVELVEGKARWKVERSFEVDESGPPRGLEFQRLLEPLSFIATPEEMDWLRSLPTEQQTQGWEEFWRRRDPTPDTPRNETQIEFFRRVRYAEHHYRGFGPGWRSDMGRIYIKFGPPDQIENRPATVTMPQLEIWYYNQPYRRFVFGDREGYGRYTLLPGSSAE